ncbi:TetR/AcrR family transcriptional regulator [Planomonospora parontospora]|uniref:TetR/AcrR family transcriptional regulator n=1 Tax=Planomonospora parontospora TaxID=58119 RepID=UPI0016704507|nr:TetR family transcriptional regulator [Planomonospora parontospora]GGL18130.1 TetR family transcriptional regulator [Planomonospora parontospora subsp. antibiotica]GII15593.1 TetR family transcriptional regulator [Planomonospora parontospora subsp. antibiotica]
MRKNPERRQALIDAAIEVLAREGARGLTFRAVDVEAAVPPGTASNYFANRDDLFTQIGGRIYERLLPDEAAIARSRQGAQDETRYAELMHELVDRVSAFDSGYLALLELRLESTRRPELRAVLTRRIREDIDANIGHHAASGLPGDPTSVVLLYLALNWLIVERLTLPDIFTEQEIRELVDAAVRRALHT